MSLPDLHAPPRPMAPADRADAQRPRSAPQPRLHSDDLFVAGPVVEIAHGDAIYRLRRTSLGKLILTK